ncbi:hypothetical protein [Sutcliffiella rhizosphaerae]|uniref:hypothetical protein n=1 Tax=Sutcliffiella rhizosphaerae TaxID=2880967 RepID=UPI001E2AB72F|nr:hypothetical protein [Sutcliffiella rhizosphaerae]
MAHPSEFEVPQLLFGDFGSYLEILSRDLVISANYLEILCQDLEISNFSEHFWAGERRS